MGLSKFQCVYIYMILFSSYSVGAFRIPPLYYGIFKKRLFMANGCRNFSLIQKDVFAYRIEPKKGEIAFFGT